MPRRYMMDVVIHESFSATTREIFRPQSGSVWKLDIDHEDQTTGVAAKEPKDDDNNNRGLPKNSAARFWES